MYSAYSVYGVNSVYSVFSVYSVQDQGLPEDLSRGEIARDGSGMMEVVACVHCTGCTVCKLCTVSSVYSIYSVYGIYSMHSMYSVYSVYMFCSPDHWMTSSDWGHKTPKELVLMLSMVYQKSKVRSNSKYYDCYKWIGIHVFD